MELMNTTNLQQEPAEENSIQQTVRTPDKSEYLQRILALSAEDQAFMDGYLFAKVTDAAGKGA